MRLRWLTRWLRWLTGYSCGYTAGYKQGFLDTGRRAYRAGYADAQAGRPPADQVPLNLHGDWGEVIKK